MATIPLDNVFVTLGSLDSSGSQTSIGSTITDMSGNYNYTWQTTEADYNKYVQMRMGATKTGFLNKTETVALPSFNSAVNNGIMINTTMMSSQTADFYIIPDNITTPSTGGARTLTVVCQDATWSIESADPLLTATRVNDTTISISVPSGSTQEVFRDIVIRWNNKTASCTVTRNAQEEQPSNQINFSGIVKEYGTNTPISGAIVSRWYRYTVSGTDQIVTAVGEVARTNSSGQYSFSLDLTEDRWNDIGPISLYASKAGYDEGVSTINTSQISYSSAISSGVVVPDIVLQSNAEKLFTIMPDYYLYRYSGGYWDVVITSPDNTWTIESPGTDWVTITRTDDTHARVTVSPNNTENAREYPVVFKWNNIERTHLASQENNPNITFTVQPTNVSIRYYGSTDFIRVENATSWDVINFPTNPAVNLKYRKVSNGLYLDGGWADLGNGSTYPFIIRRTSPAPVINVDCYVSRDSSVELGRDSYFVYNEQPEDPYQFPETVTFTESQLPIILFSTERNYIQVNGITYYKYGIRGLFFGDSYSVGIRSIPSYFCRDWYNLEWVRFARLDHLTQNILPKSMFFGCTSLEEINVGILDVGSWMIENDITTPGYEIFNDLPANGLVTSKTYRNSYAWIKASNGQLENKGWECLPKS